MGGWGGWLWVRRGVVILYVHCMTRCSRSEPMHYAPAQAAHMVSRQSVYINIRQWEYVQNSSHALVLVCSQHLFQYRPVSHGFITQAREGIKSFAEVLSIYWKVLLWHSLVIEGFDDNVWVASSLVHKAWRKTMAVRVDCISLHLLLLHAYLAASLERESVNHPAGKQRPQVKPRQGQCELCRPLLSWAEKVLCV